MVRPWFGLEAAKFGLYLSIPIIATCVYTDAINLSWIINERKYIKYPAADYTREEFRAMMLKGKKDNQG